MQTYNSIKETQAYKQDNNSCTVVASALAFDTDYTEMTSYYASKGRRAGRGVAHSLSVDIVKTLAKAKGYKYKRMQKLEIIKLTKGKTMTVGNSKKYLDKSKNYVIFSAGHAIGAVGGVVDDFTKTSKRPIHTIIELTPPKNKVATLQNIREADITDLLAQATQLLKG